MQRARVLQVLDSGWTLPHADRPHAPEPSSAQQMPQQTQHDMAPEPAKAQPAVCIVPARVKLEAEGVPPCKRMKSGETAAIVALKGAAPSPSELGAQRQRAVYGLRNACHDRLRVTAPVQPTAAQWV